MRFSENSIVQGDCIEVMKSMPDNYVSALITDPPYGLSNHSEKLVRETLSKWLSGEEDYIPKGKGFMGKSWDSFVPPPAVWKECFRVMKPGAVILVFAGTRASDLMTISLRLAGFEVKDNLMYMYGSGFPKSLDISKAIDKLKGVEREIIGKGKSGKTAIWQKDGGMGDYPITVPKTTEAKQWEGYGTALKPAYEPIIMAIKPNDGGYANNALKWGVAGLNIDDCRIVTNDNLNGGAYSGEGKMKHIADHKWGFKKRDGQYQQPIGRFPSNVILDEETAKLLDEQSGISKSVRSTRGVQRKGYSAGVEWERATEETNTVRGYNDKGGASRFFYCDKASKSERTANGQIENNHPTLKPLSLMKYLVKLVNPPENGLILDPFAGSGSTCVACKMLGVNFIGIEKEFEYVDIARKRLELTEKEREQSNLF